MNHDFGSHFFSERPICLVGRIKDPDSTGGSRGWCRRRSSQGRKGSEKGWKQHRCIESSQIYSYIIMITHIYILIYMYIYIHIYSITCIYIYIIMCICIYIYISYNFHDYSCIIYAPSTLVKYPDIHIHLIRGKPITTTQGHGREEAKGGG